MSLIFSYILPIGLLLLCVFLILILLKKSKRTSLLAGKLEESEMKLKIREDEIERYKHQVEELVQSKTLEIQEEEQEHLERDLALKKKLKRSEEASFLKNAFLSSISHEIRTPLNNIIGFASLLEAEISIMENKELFDYSRAISESGDRLISILDNIIDISRIESHDLQVTLKEVQVNQTIASAVQLFLFKANEQKLKLNFIPHEVPLAIADEKNLTKVLTIILDNAIKYTEKGFVNVSTDYSPDNNEIRVRIKDSGIGIDPAFQVDIFDPFRKEPSGFTKEAQGAGLGLPLARSLIDLMKGRIHLESAKGSGTTVTIWLQAVQKVSEEQKPVKAPPIRGIRLLENLEIFIVEDDLMNKMVLFQMTKSLGNVTTAMNGDETLRILEKRMGEHKLFDIMLFDINLPPPWDGIRLMQEIRNKWKEFRSIPFIAQTAYAMVGDKEKLLEAGFDDYISKPINQKELYTIMKNQLNKF